MTVMHKANFMKEAMKEANLPCKTSFPAWRLVYDCDSDCACFVLQPKGIFPGRQRKWDGMTTLRRLGLSIFTGQPSQVATTE